MKRCERLRVCRLGRSAFWISPGKLTSKPRIALCTQDLGTQGCTQPWAVVIDGTNGASMTVRKDETLGYSGLGYSSMTVRKDETLGYSGLGYPSMTVRRDDMFGVFRIGVFKHDGGIIELRIKKREDESLER